MSANLIWGPPLAPHLLSLVGPACEGLRQLGYFASAFPEGDGVTLSHPAYSADSALSHVRAHFAWLDVDDQSTSEGELYSSTEVECKILVPIEKLRLTRVIRAGPYLFLPALGDDESDIAHPWHEYLSSADADSIRNAREAAARNQSLGITRDDFLLTYPLVETSARIPYAELIAANEYPDGQSPLLRRCAEIADRGLDLVRFEECTYRQLERLCGVAGQLLDGFHAAYVIPGSGPIKARLYCHFAVPFQVTPNWLGLDVERDLQNDTLALAPVVHSAAGSEMSLRVRAALRAAGQAFYILTPEARFLSLVFALDGLCAPRKKWSGLAHHAYVAAIAADGNAFQFDVWLRGFDGLYSDVRNPIVHRGSSFIELGADPKQTSDQAVGLIQLCVGTIMRRGFAAVHDLHTHFVAALQSPSLHAVLATYVAHLNASRPPGDQIKMPKW